MSWKYETVRNRTILVPFENEHFFIMEGYDEALKE